MARRELRGRLLLTADNQSQAGERTRTADPFITSEVLYQLSYAGGVGPL